MGILSRFADIMGANINSLLSKSEDKNAHKLLEKYLEDAKENLAEVKAEASAVIAEETGLARKLADNENECAKFASYAAAAVKSGNDGDARKFLTVKTRLEGERADLSAQYMRAKDNSEKMRQLLRKLTDDVNAAEDKMGELKAKLTVAKNQEKMNDIGEKFGDDPLARFDDLLDTVQKRVDAADAARSLDEDYNHEHDEIESLTMKYDISTQEVRTDQVEDQLAMLKASLGK